MIQKKPFVKYELEENKQDIISLKLNAEERQLFEELKYFIQQEKDSTALKQLALEIASKVILDEKMKAINKVVLDNYRKNKRLRIVTFD